MRRRALLSLLLTTVLLPIVALRAHATVADDLCPSADDPCVVSGAVAIDAGSTIELGARTLQLATGAKVSWTGDLTVNAEGCDFRLGSALAESAATTGDHFLNLNCTTSALAGIVATLGAGVIVTGPGPHVLSGAIQARGDQVGVIAIDSYAPPGHITVSGKIQAKSKTGTPPGEFRLWSNFGDILVTDTAKIQVKGATADPFTEFFFFEADSGSLTVNGSVDARAKSGAYAFNFEANQAVRFGPRSKVNAKAKGTGAEMAINSQVADVTLQGSIKAPAKAVSGGHGARVHVCAGHDILVDGKASIDASSGFDGSIILGAFNQARVGAGGVGAKLVSKTDGDIEVCGGTSGSISSASKVVPDAEAVGSGVCLSPESQVIFLLDCSS
jgi:hypothetical protein